MFSYKSLNPPRIWSIETGARTLVRIADPEGRVSGVVGVARLSDGRLAVANRGSNQILVFDHQGTFQRALGRSGKGPFEFSNISRLLRVGDTLIGVDGDSRAHTFTAAGGQVATTAPVRLASGHLPRRLFVTNGGSGVVTYFDGSSRAEATATHIKLVVARLSAGGESIVELTSMMGYQTSGRKDAPGPLLLGPQGTVAASEQRFCAGVSDKYEISCLSASGRLLSRTSLPVRSRAIDDKDKKIFADAYLAANANAPPQVKAQMQEAVKHLPFAESAPVFGRVLLSRNDDLWIGEFYTGFGLPGRLGTQAPSDPHLWRVFAPDGSWIAQVLLPAGFLLWEAGTDYVAGVQYDDDGVEEVVVFPLLKSVK